MENKEDLYQKAQLRLTDYLEARRMRKTPERYEVLKTVCQMRDIFTIDQLANQMQEGASFCVSRSTLFNTLEIFAAAKLVIKHNLVRASLYEYNIEPQPRACLVCEHCGMVRRLDKIEVTEYLSGIKTRQFSVMQPVLYLHGTCRKCAMIMIRANSKKKKNS